MDSYGIIIGSPNGTVPNASPITIRNGTITNFLTGILDFRTSDITINNVVFNQNFLAVELNTVSNATINNCQFNGLSAQSGLTSAGIHDFASPGGNTYNYNTFTNIYQRLSVDGTIVLDRCQFDQPPSN